jgi:hypothetical protein
MTESKDTLTGFKRVDGCAQTHSACPCLTALKAERDEAKAEWAKTVQRNHELRKVLEMQVKWRMRCDGSPCTCPAGRGEDEPIWPDADHALNLLRDAPRRTWGGKGMNSFKPVALEILAHLPPAVAKRALKAERWYLGGAYVDPQDGLG